MSEQDALIDLLNDFGGSNSYGKFDTVVFLDEDGMPTDRFLQALKADRSLPSFDDTNNISANYYNGNNHSYLNDQEFEIEKKEQNGRITDHNYFDEVKNNRNVQFNQEIPEHLPNESFISSALFTGTNNKKSKTNITKPLKEKKKKQTKIKNSTSTYMQEHRNNQGISEKTTTASNLKQRTLSNSEHHGYTSAIGSNSSHSNRIAMNNTVEEVHFPRAVGIDTTEIEVEAESRVKSLQLRLQGQLQTIRSLESQLSEALQLVEARNKQLAHCNARLKAHSSSTAATSSSNNVSTGMHTGNASLRSEAAIAKATELAEQYKVQADFLQAKLLEEQGKRQRAEERARVLKNYSEKAKARCVALESQSAELKGAIAEMTGRMEKFRKSYKDNASEVHAHRTEVAAKDEENARLRRQLEKSESAVRNLQMTLEHSREELRTAKVECSAAQSRAKQLSMQADIQQQRDATRRAEERLRGLAAGSPGSSSRTQPRPHYEQDIRRQSKQQPSQYRYYDNKNKHHSSSSTMHTNRNTSMHSPGHVTWSGLEEAQLSALQQSGYLQHLMEADLAAHTNSSEAHRNEWLFHIPPPPLAVPSQQQSSQQRPPIPPSHTVHNNTHHSETTSTQLRASLEHRENNLDRDVVHESMMEHKYSPTSSSSSAASALPPRPPPRVRSNSSNSLYSDSTNTVKGGTERSLLSIRAQQRSLGQHHEEEEGEGEVASSRGRYVSMSDSEVEPRDRGRDRDSAALLRSSADLDRRSSSITRNPSTSATAPEKYGERSALSFIRQRAISSSSIGSNTSEINTTKSSYNPTVRSNTSSINNQHLERVNTPSPSRYPEQVRTSRDSTPSVVSSTPAPFSRLQALYEKVSNRTV